MEKGTSGSRCRLLPEGESGEQDDRRGEDPDRLPREPLPLSALRDAEHEEHEPRRDERCARDVVALSVRVPALREQDRGERETGDADGDVDEEDPLPGEEVGEDPAHEDAGRGAEAADRPPGAERDVALFPLTEGRGQDRERRGGDRGRAQPLERPGRDQRLVTPCEPAEQRADREDDEAAHEDASAPEDVGEPAAEQEEPSEDQGIGADHPLQVFLREAEIRLDRRQRDIHDRDVEHHHELHGAEERQREPSCPVGCDHRTLLPPRAFSSRRRTGGARGDSPVEEPDSK